jgi:hypothetical protein
MSETALAKLDKARQALAESRTLDEVKQIRNMAEAARTYAKAAHLGREAQNYAGEIKLLAERKAGELLGQLDKSKPGPKKLDAKLAPNSEYTQTLKDTNTPKRTAQYWQKIAQVPENTVHEYIETTRKTGKGEVTTAGLLREAAKIRWPKTNKVLDRHERWRKLDSAVRSLYDSLPFNQRVKEIHDACLQVILGACLCDVCYKHSDNIGNNVGSNLPESAGLGYGNPTGKAPTAISTPAPTKQHSVFELLSTLQKAIRRGDEREALLAAWQLDANPGDFKVAKKFGGQLWSAMRKICAEDTAFTNIGLTREIRSLQANWIKATRTNNEHEPWRLFTVRAVLLLCRSPKSRLVDHACFVISGRLEQLCDELRKVPQPHPIQAYAHDGLHTGVGAGKNKAPALADFIRNEDAVLTPKAEGIDDPYKEEIAGALREAAAA